MAHFPSGLRDYFRYHVNYLLTFEALHRPWICWRTGYCFWDDAGGPTRGVVERGQCSWVNNWLLSWFWAVLDLARTGWSTINLYCVLDWQNGLHYSLSLSGEPNTAPRTGAWLPSKSLCFWSNWEKKTNECAIFVTNLHLFLQSSLLKLLLLDLNIFRIHLWQFTANPRKVKCDKYFSPNHLPYYSVHTAFCGDKYGSKMIRLPSYSSLKFFFGAEVLASFSKAVADWLTVKSVK